MQHLEVEPAALAHALEAGEPIQVLDIRAPQRLAAGVVEPVPAERFRNVRGSEIAAMTELDPLGLQTDLPVAVVCSRGNDSIVIATLLSRHGYDARSLRGGINAWMRLVVPRELEPPPGFDRLVQFDRVGKGALGYLLASAEEALIIDPPRSWKEYAEQAAEAGALIVGVADTHVHADYISGGPVVAAELDVPYYLHPADAVYPYDGTPGVLEFASLSDDQIIKVGRGSVRVLHTPGHTMGHVTFLAGPGDGPTDHDVAFTGDFVFVESVGRPDLAGRTDEWCGDLWQSLERARNEWPAGMRVYPAHYATEAERNPDRSVGRPFGHLREVNDSLLIGDEQAFRTWVTSSVATPPEAYRHIKAINVGLLAASPDEADVLEAGKNECAVG
jgi:glyoxylase-like metal-dependent hydrolase (beta-lactamase superfamily II)